MRALIQRVRRAKVEAGGETIGRIGEGLLILLGVAADDRVEDADELAKKCFHLRIFEDENGKMNRSVGETRGAALVVSQFTLYGDTSGSGRRPSFSGAARPEKAVPCYERFVRALRNFGMTVETGRFGAEMAVELVNDGPVTLMVEFPKQPHVFNKEKKS